MDRFKKRDWFKILIEGLYLKGEFKLYGKIIFAEFFNDGKNKEEDSYFDENGKSRIRAFLRTPLNFKKISSRFSYTSGTPVSAIGDGVVQFAGFKGDYGNLVIIKHKNNYTSYYGHLLRIPKYIKIGSKVKQGEIIGYVGSTSLATGPHLHYELRAGSKPINSFKLKIPEGKEIPESKKDAYFSAVNFINDKIKDLKSEKNLFWRILNGI